MTVGMRLDEMDPELIAQLRAAGDRWGPLGVAEAAAQLTDPAVLVADLIRPEPREDGPSLPVPTRGIVAVGGWTAPIEIGTPWMTDLEEQEDGTFVPTSGTTATVESQVRSLDAALPVVPTERGGLRFGQPPPPGYVPPEPPVVHRVTLTAYGDSTNPGAGMLQLECSCGEILWEQDEPRPVPLAELARLAGEHEFPGEEEW